MSMVRLLSEIEEPKVSELGGKGYPLATLINNGFNVPKGFVVISGAFFQYLKQNNLVDKIKECTFEGDQSTFRERCQDIKLSILNGEIPTNIVLGITDKLNKLDIQSLCIRSSAMSEDSSKESFAGLHDTFLNIKAKCDLILRYTRRCWASLFSERAIAYRLNRELAHFEGMAVVVQEMVPAEISGVTFTVHPAHEKSLLLEASYGIGDTIMSGKVQPDDYIVSRKELEIVRKRIARKSKMSIIGQEGIEVVGVEQALTEKQALPDDKIKQIANTCLKVEKIFGYPQEIEWCIAKGRVWLLQSRATTLPVTQTTGTVRKGIVLRGIPASPGTAKGEVVVVKNRDNDNLHIDSSKILVVQKSDPSLTPLIIPAIAVVIEYGSLATHVVRICREIGKPCVAQVEHACNIMLRWKFAYVDGSSGTISKLEESEE